ncbi:MAG: hypothetical protein V4640_11915 [Verrucomicrobiota bacterium]
MAGRNTWLSLAILTTVVLVAWRNFAFTAVSPSTSPLGNSTQAARKGNSLSAADGDSLAARSVGKMIESDWDDLLLWLGSDPPPSASEIREKLLALRTQWAEMDPTLVAETIARLLAFQRDATTGLKIQVGLHGFLDGWPTLRIFLLDALVVADPETAAKIARGILDSTESPDEYAIALRSLTRDQATNSSTAELLDRFSHALAKPEWQASGGFAESLDLARTIGTSPAATKLLRWNGNPALKSMALHEFAADHPAEMLQALEEDPAVAPVVRANLMARLDPAEPAQLTAIDRYLRDPQLDTEDASVFLKSFPLRSATTGNRLYSPAPSPYEMERIAAGDSAALSLVTGWAADPALESLRPELLALQTRLAEWVEQAK